MSSSDSIKLKLLNSYVQNASLEGHRSRCHHMIETNNAADKDSEPAEVCDGVAKLFDLKYIGSSLQSPGEAVDAYIIIPPLVKYVAGPLLGPSLLAGAARTRKLSVEILDLNCMLLAKYASSIIVCSDHNEWLYGDHCNANMFDRIASQFWKRLSADVYGRHGDGLEAKLMRAAIDHDEVSRAVRQLISNSSSRFILRQLMGKTGPRVVGMSVMWSGQTVMALVTSAISKELWPETKVVWGGAQISSIRQRIEKEREFGLYVDGFIPGHCEGSFVDLLISMRRGKFEAPGLIIPGNGPSPDMPRCIYPPPVPRFQNLDLYGMPRLVLPVQLSTGCSYGKCAFCTYPAVEGDYKAFSAWNCLKPVIDIASKNGAALSIKDSLVTVERLREIGDLIGGRVHWSACTKIDPRLNSTFLCDLYQNGCRTLEVGLETVNQRVQKIISKRQPTRLLDNFLRGAAESGISVVINYITGFPWECETDAILELRWLRRHISGFPGLKAVIEHNRFELEKLSPIAKNPEKYGIVVVKTWPWSSVISYHTTDTASTTQS